MKTITADECIEILNCERSKFLDLVRAGDIPGAKIGRSWVFLEEDIYAYLQRRIAEQQELCAERERVRQKILNGTADLDEMADVGILIRRRRRRR